MLSVIHPGWLLLLLCGAALLLVGCAVFPIRTPPQPTTTAFPLVTLTVIPFNTDTPQPYSTQPPASLVAPVRTPDWLVSRTVASQPPTAIQIDMPVCYDGPNLAVTCLGWVRNKTHSMLEQVALRLAWTNDDASGIQQIIALEQRRIPPHSSAPYRIILTHEDFSSLWQIETAQYQSIEMEAQPVVITGARGAVSASGRYIITANLRNSSSLPAAQIRLAAMLLAPDDRLVGYRVVDRPGTMQPGEEQTVRIEIIPLEMADSIHHILEIESRTRPAGPR